MTLDGSYIVRARAIPEWPIFWLEIYMQKSYADSWVVKIFLSIHFRFNQLTCCFSIFHPLPKSAVNLKFGVLDWWRVMIMEHSRKTINYLLLFNIAMENGP